MKKKVIFIILSILIVILSVLIIVCLFSKDIKYTAETKSFKAEDISLSSDYKDYLWDLNINEDWSFQEDSEYNSDIIAAYKNKNDETVLFMFASPIRYYNKQGVLDLIDTRISNVTEKSYSKYYAYQTYLNDLNSYYPKRLDKGILLESDTYSYSFGVLSDCLSLADYQESYINIAGRERQIVKYDSALSENFDLMLYPTRYGTGAEFQIEQSDLADNVLNFWLDCNSADCELSDNGYVALRTGEGVEDVVGVIQAPVLMDSAGNVSVNSKFSVEDFSMGKKKLSVILDKDFLQDEETKFPVKCYISFDLKRDNQPDSAVFSSKQSMNSYLSGFSAIGQSDDLGKGEIRVRFKLSVIENLTSDKIDKVYYKVHSLTQEEDQFEVRHLTEIWCSHLGSWNQPIKEGKQVDKADLLNGTVRFDITDAAKVWCDDSTNTIERYGLVLKSLYQKEETWNLLSSNDSSLYNNVTEVVLKNYSYYPVVS